MLIVYAPLTLQSVYRSDNIKYLILITIGKKVMKPNIVTFLFDDMGFSDLGCLSGEIDTPNMDKLAHSGFRATQFYNTARCCPARASLLTGLYPHQAGVGMMVYRDFQVVSCRSSEGGCIVA